MAVPVNARIFRAAPLKTGIILGVSPSSDPTFDFEVARATSSGVYETIDRLSPNTAGVYPSFTDILPGTTNTFSYKARAIKDGWNAGDYTAVVTARPISLPEIPPPITPLTGKGIGAPLFISTGAPPKYGRPNSAQAYEKGFVLYPFQFTSTSSTVAFAANHQYLYPRSTAARSFYWQSAIPDGSSVSGVSLMYRRPTVAGTLRFRIQTFSASTVTATSIDYTATGAGAGIFTKTFSSGFGGNSGLFVRLDMTSTSGSTASVMLRGVDFSYRQPNLAVSV